MSVRDRIAKLIEDRGLKQVAVARRAGRPDYWLSNRLTGRTAIHADDVPIIASALGLPVASLYSDDLLEEGVAFPPTVPTGILDRHLGAEFIDAVLDAKARMSEENRRLADIGMELLGNALGEAS